MENEEIVSRLDNLERRVNGKLTDDLFTRAEVEYMIEATAEEAHDDFDCESLADVEFGINGNEIYIENASYGNNWGRTDTEGILYNCLQNREQDA